MKDPRAGSLALSAICEFEKLGSVCDPLRTACIALVSQGCEDHLEKVLDAARQKRVKPGNFIRMGPHTVATYLAMAMGFHGPAFALLTDRISEGYEAAEDLLSSGLVDHVCLILAETDGCKVCLIPS